MHTRTSVGLAYLLMALGICLVGTDAWSRPSRLIPLVAPDGATLDNFGVSGSLDGDTVVLGAHWNDDRGPESGSVYVFERNASGNWSAAQKLTASDGAPDAHFGNAVALQDDTLLVGSVQADSPFALRAGAVYAFVRAGDGTWHETQKLVVPFGSRDDKFGWSIAISGDRAVVAAHRDDERGTDAGAAYVLERRAGLWRFTAKLTAPDSRPGARLGSDVDVEGDRVLVGAYYDPQLGDKAGAAYVFERDLDGSWRAVDRLVASDGRPGDRFGNTVSLSGDTLAVGAYRHATDAFEEGAVYVFERGRSGRFRQIQQLVGVDPAPKDHFGFSVSLEEDFLLVGAVQDDATAVDSGSVHLYRRRTATWHSAGRITPAEAHEGSWFGWFVDLDGEDALVGAERHDGSAPASGAAWILE